MFENENPKRLVMEVDSGSDLSDYNDNFAEEYRIKQMKMLGELQSIYDDKSQLTQQINQITRELSVDEPDNAELPEALMFVETPTSAHNDS